jgi:hypothetical protein
LYIYIRKKKVNKKRNLSASNDFSQTDVELFVSKIKEIAPFPKLRDVAKILKPYFTLDKINAILKYLERSDQIIIDLDGNIVWIKENNLKSNLSLQESGRFSEDFMKYFGK